LLFEGRERRGPRSQIKEKKRKGKKGKKRKEKNERKCLYCERLLLNSPEQNCIISDFMI
jgi:hypothetical protein